MREKKVAHPKRVPPEADDIASDQQRENRRDQCPKKQVQGLTAMASISIAAPLGKADT